jgi:hypothetical protein
VVNLDRDPLVVSSISEGSEEAPHGIGHQIRRLLGGEVTSLWEILPLPDIGIGALRVLPGKSPLTPLHGNPYGHIDADPKGLSRHLSILPA